MIYTLQNLPALGLCLPIHDSGLFAWISQTALSRTYFIIAAIQDGHSLHIEETQPTPYQKAQFYYLLGSFNDQTGRIYTHIYAHVKYGSNLIRTF